MTTNQDFENLIQELGFQFARRTAEHDEKDQFVEDNFRALREHKVFSAAIPKELGGGGITHRQMCRALRMLARQCSSTALSLSMHQHLVAAQVWNHLHGKPGKALLEKVVAGELILVSTGANDWLSSTGHLEKVDGGYRLTAKKHFASGCPMGSLLITSAPFEDPKEGWQVLHFPVPFSADGVHIGDDWRALGMRGTGSHTVDLRGVFIPEGSVALRRPRGQFHPVWNVVLTVAMPYIMSVYVGTAEAAAEIARDRAKKKSRDPVLPQLLGELENRLTTAQMAVDSMVGITNDYNFEPIIENANAILIRKTIAARACIDTVEKALEVAGGAGYFRSLGLERLLRDVHAAQFHPLTEKKQQLFTGRLALGLDPVNDAE
jgi:alkylation response protein AidB-like acyl-CoA dehydrogenase